MSELSLSTPTRNLLREMIVFEPVPGVKRAIFISAPHRGSAMAKGFLGRFFSSMIKLPTDMMGTINELASQQLSFITTDKGKVRIPTGVSALSPDSPGLKATADLQISKAVKYHTIMGNIEMDPNKPGTDGVVLNSSSYLEGAESEMTVNFGHSCQSHPLVVLKSKGF